MVRYHPTTRTPPMCLYSHPAGKSSSKDVNLRNNFMDVASCYDILKLGVGYVVISSTATCKILNPVIVIIVTCPPENVLTVGRTLRAWTLNL